MTPKEIKTLRHSMVNTKYNKAPSQRTFSVFLGFGTATIARYELGYKPQKSHEIILKKLSIDPKFIHDISEWNKESSNHKNDFDIVPNWERLAKLKLQKTLFPA